MFIDLNHQSAFIYGHAGAPPPIGERIDHLVDAALVAERAAIPARHYLGASRIGEPCPRRLCYELMQIAVDDGADLSGRMLRIFEAGHRFEDMTIRCSGSPASICERTIAAGNSSASPLPAAASAATSTV
jgi:hypothetical protein